MMSFIVVWLVSALLAGLIVLHSMAVEYKKNTTKGR
jgi:hypothetical protein